MKFGLILSLTAVLVVFAALTVLYFCYLWIGKEGCARASKAVESPGK